MIIILVFFFFVAGNRKCDGQTGHPERSVGNVKSKAQPQPYKPLLRIVIDIHMYMLGLQTQSGRGWNATTSQPNGSKEPNKYEAPSVSNFERAFFFFYPLYVYVGVGVAAERR